MLVPKLGTVPRAIVLGLGTVAAFLCTMCVVMVQQLRHHFWTIFLAHFSALHHQTHLVCYTLPRAYTGRVLIGVWKSGVVTNLGLQAAFINGFTIIYSSTTTAFATPAQSLLTLWSALLGNVDVDTFIQSRSGPARLALHCSSPFIALPSERALSVISGPEYTDRRPCATLLQRSRT